MSVACQRMSAVSMFDRALIATLALVSVLAVLPARGEDDEAIGFERIPPRLSMVEGEASFWRPGGEDWTEAQVNTPLAGGDQLYTAGDGKLEVQIGPRAFVRAAGQTQFGLDALEPDYLQMRLTEGDVSLDLRNIGPGQTIEVGTPNAVFTVEQPGYYRLTVAGPTSTFISRRGGRASVTSTTGAVAAIGGGEQAIVTGVEAPAIATAGADDLDGWDRWNYARTERQVQAVSARYVSPDVYGLADLDDHGDWRQVPTYGSVWVPRRVAVDWAPYSTGRWLHDPYYGWSWVDHSPWGWAPFHYGRWVHVSGFWGWCPGPVVVRPFYSPALVAFYGGPSFRVSIGAPFGWVALGWGEPLSPWWGPTYFRGNAWWGGWGGPRVVNRVVVHNTTVINVNRINIYENVRVRNGVVVVDGDKFGRGRVDRYRRGDIDTGKLRPVRGDLPFRPGRESLQAGDRPGRRPPRELLDRRVVSPRDVREARGARGSRDEAPGAVETSGTRSARRDAAAGDDRRRASEPGAEAAAQVAGQRSERRSSDRDNSRAGAVSPERDATAPAVREQGRRDVDVRRDRAGSQIQAETRSDRLRPPPVPRDGRSAPTRDATAPAVREQARRDVDVRRDRAGSQVQGETRSDRLRPPPVPRDGRSAPSRDATAPAVREQVRRDVDVRRDRAGSQVQAETRSDRLRPPPVPRDGRSAPSRETSIPAVREQARRDVDQLRDRGAARAQAERLRPPPVPRAGQSAPSARDNAVREQRRAAPSQGATASAPPRNVQRYSAPRQPEVRANRRESAPARERGSDVVSNQRRQAPAQLQQRSGGSVPSVRSMPRSGSDSRQASMRGGSVASQPSMRSAPRFGGGSPQASVRGERGGYSGGQRGGDRAARR